MSSVMKYKDYIGSVEFSEEDQLFYGKVLGIHSLISYEGESAKELIQDFHDAVDDYLELCVEKRIEPEKAYKGSFNVRISPDLHRSIAIHAIQDGMTLNKYVEEALQNAISATQFYNSYNFILALQNLRKSYFGLPFFIYIRNIHSINRAESADERSMKRIL